MWSTSGCLLGCALRHLFSGWFLKLNFLCRGLELLDFSGQSKSKGCWLGLYLCSFLFCPSPLKIHCSSGAYQPQEQTGDYILVCCGNFQVKVAISFLYQWRHVGKRSIARKLVIKTLLVTALGKLIGRICNIAHGVPVTGGKVPNKFGNPLIFD